MRRRIRKSSGENSNYWMSIGDLMAGALIIFILLFVLQILDINKKIEDGERAKKQIKNLQNKIKVFERTTGVKEEIIAKLMKKFKEENLHVDIDSKTGNIKLDDSILFNFNSAELKPEGKEFLKEFIPKYVSVLLSDEFKKSVTQIIIEGHTDNKGMYLYNLDLSQRRAFAVVQFIYSGKIPYFKGKEELKKVITANGRGKMKLIYKPNSRIVDRKKSRRVEFQFRLNNEESIKMIKDLLKSEVS
ncbi:MAG: OmpA family protein [Fusobacterium sp. JB019]|nr:OmpA family protein [Fusobacterium sp. JB019]